MGQLRRILVLVVVLFFFACRSTGAKKGGRSMLMESPLFEESNIPIPRPLGASRLLSYAKGYAVGVAFAIVLLSSSLAAGNSHKGTV
jgi:hypothetical protein